MTMRYINLLLSRRYRQRERLSASVLSICSSVCRQNVKNAIFLKTMQFRPMISIDDLQELGSRTWTFQRTHYGTPKIQDGGDPPSGILTPKCKNAIFSKTKQFGAMVSIDDYKKLCNWAFQRTHYWIPKIQDG